jgi:hypothetical protein
MSDDPLQPRQEPASDRPWYEYVSTGYGQFPYGGMPSMPPYAPAPARPSHRRLWLTLLIVGIVLVLFVCGGCMTASFFGFRYIQQNLGPVLVASQYYGAVKEQEYDLAYSYLDAHALIQGQHLSLAAFIHLAQTIDATRGKVTQDIPTSFTKSGALPRVNMLVTREKQTYSVSLQLRREGNDWKIVSANRI